MEAAALEVKPGDTIINRHTAEKLFALCEKIWEEPQVKKGYAEWHLKKYGCLPEEVKKEK